MLDGINFFTSILKNFASAGFYWPLERTLTEHSTGFIYHQRLIDKPTNDGRLWNNVS